MVNLVTKARSVLVLEAFFWASLVLRLELKEDSTCQTMWTDGKTLGYNLLWTKSITSRKRIGVLAHEACHVMMLHHLRRNGRDPKKWNIACDYAVNCIVRKIFELPDGALYDSKFEDMSAEEIFSILFGKDKGNDSDDDSKRGKGKTADEDDDSGDPGECGEIRDAKNDDGSEMSNADKKQAEADWKVNIAQAKAQAEKMGQGLGQGLERMIDEILTPTLGADVLMDNFVSEVTYDEYSFKKADRRFIEHNIHLPSLYRERLDTIALAIDTSGSVNQRALNETTANLKHIIETTGAECYIIHCDSRIHKIEHYEDGEFPDEVVPVGGGGTDFRPVFDFIEEEAIDPACLLYFTDLYGTFPDEEPLYPVLWITWEKYPTRKPLFGQIISAL